MCVCVRVLFYFVYLCVFFFFVFFFIYFVYLCFFVFPFILFICVFFFHLFWDKFQLEWDNSGPILREKGRVSDGMGIG